MSLAPPDQFLNAALSTSLVGLAGIGGINPVDLSKLLAGKIASASPYISDYTHGVSGSATPTGSRDGAAAGVSRFHGAQW